MTYLPSVAKKLLVKHEGLRLTAYPDTMGKITIGVGRNLVDRGITKDEAMHLLANDIVYFHKELLRLIPCYHKLDDVRQLALLSMAFNMGVTDLLGFQKMLKAIQDKRWTVAKMEALDSRWAKQVGDRAIDISDMILTGELPHGFLE